MTDVIRFVDQVICTAGGLAAVIVGVAALIVGLFPGIILRGRKRK